MEDFIAKVESFLDKSNSERRRSPRKDLSLNMKFRINNAQAYSKVQPLRRGMLLNISRTGMLFHTSYKVPKPGEVVVFIPTADKNKPLKSICTVIRSNVLSDGIYSVAVHVIRVIK